MYICERVSVALWVIKLLLLFLSLYGD